MDSQYQSFDSEIIFPDEIWRYSSTVKIKQASILHHLNGLPAFPHCLHAKKSITIVGSENNYQKVMTTEP